MQKFFVLVKKEVKELLTPQMVVPLLVTVVIFVFIGKVLGKSASVAATASMPITVLDLDHSALSKTVVTALQKSHFDPAVLSGGTPAEALAQAKEKKQSAAIVIPAGFEAGVNGFAPQKIEVYNVLTNFSFFGNRGIQTVSAAIAAINDAVSNQSIAAATRVASPQTLKQPITAVNYVSVDGREAAANPAEVIGYITNQTSLIPIILFLVILISAQLIAVAIATEKENKTLETLLSSPVSRRSIVSAKLVGAGLVALLTAVVYLFGLRYYMNGVTGGALQGGTSGATQAALSSLGLTFTAADYVILGVVLFFGIITALSIALILGAFAEDAKSAQGVIAPLMVLLMVPYILVTFVDMNSLSPAIKGLLYAIPFTQPFLAVQNILLHQYQSLVLGILYMAVWFLVFIFLAAKIFSSDRILTLKLNFRKKRLFS